MSGRTLRDFSDHPLAGLPVRIYLEAKDAAGQTGDGEPIEIVLPERSFAHPVARALVALRKRLSDPRERRAVADDLAGDRLAASRVSRRCRRFAGACRRRCASPPG